MGEPIQRTIEAKGLRFNVAEQGNPPNAERAGRTIGVGMVARRFVAEGVGPAAVMVDRCGSASGAARDPCATRSRPPDAGASGAAPTP